MKRLDRNETAGVNYHIGISLETRSSGEKPFVERRPFNRTRFKHTKPILEQNVMYCLQSFFFHDSFFKSVFVFYIFIFIIKNKKYFQNSDHERNLYFPFPIMNRQNRDSIHCDFLGQWDIFILLFQTFIKIKSKKKSRRKNM